MAISGYFWLFLAISGYFCLAWRSLMRFNDRADSLRCRASADTPDTRSAMASKMSSPSARSSMYVAASAHLVLGTPLAFFFLGPALVRKLCSISTWSRTVAWVGGEGKGGGGKSPCNHHAILITN